MTALSIHLPESLAKASQEIAEQMGISRTQFIRQALAHEIEQYYSEREQNEMVKSFKAMRKRASGHQVIEDFDEGFGDEQLPEDEEDWWTGQ